MGRGDSYELQGQQGGVVLNSMINGDDYAPFRWVSVLQDAEISEIGGMIDNESDLAGPVLPAGTFFGGHITALNIASGTVIAYYA